MGKIDYTKIEQALEDEILSIKKSYLLKLADQTINLGKIPPTKKEEEKEKLEKQISMILKNLEEEIKKIKKQDPIAYEQLGITPKELNRLFHSSSKLSLEDWQTIKSLHLKLEEIQTKLKENASSNPDEDLIQKERKKQTTKRFNINDKWIPL